MMKTTIRLGSLGSVLLLSMGLACGGGPKPPVDTPEPSPSAPASSSGTADVTPAPADSTPTPAASASASAPATPPPPPPSTLSGKIGGADFAVQAAQSVGPVMKDGRLLIGFVDYAAACTTAHTPAQGEHTLGLMIPAKVGKFDFTKTMKAPRRGQMPDAFFNTIGADGKPAGDLYKATGTIEVTAVSGDDKIPSHVKLDLKSGSDAFKGEIDVADCGFGRVKK